jgi:RNase P protein component
LLPGWDLILIARPALPSKSLQEIRRVLTSLLRRAQIISLSNES